MTEDSRATGQLAEDPEGDTLDEHEGDTAENTQQAQQPDEEYVPAARYREVQAAFTRSQQALRERENEILRERQFRQAAAQPRQVDPNDPLAVREARLAERERQVAWDAEWSLVRQRYSPEEIEAYQEASRNWQLDPSPLGAMNGFVQGMRVLSEKRTTKTAPVPAATRREAVRPRVDTSRSDAPDPAAIDKEIAGAKERGDLKGGVAALLKRAGSGR